MGGDSVDRGDTNDTQSQPIPHSLVAVLLGALSILRTAENVVLDHGRAEKANQ